MLVERVQNYARNREIRNYGMALPRKDILEKNHAHSTTRLARFARQQQPYFSSPSGMTCI